MQQTPSLWHRLFKGSIVVQIIVGMLVGILLATTMPAVAANLTFLGTLFVKALKALAPILVFVLVISALAGKQHGVKSNMRPVLMLYLIGTFAAALAGVGFSFMFPSELALANAAANSQPPQAIGQVLSDLLFKLVDNPVNALQTGNFIGILAWAVGIGLAMQHVSQATKQVMHDLSHAISSIVHFAIRFAPLGVMGLVADTILTSGLHALLGYSHLLAVLLGAMLFVAVVINPILVFAVTRRNPFPLVLTCLRESGVTAFFTRSSAANIPVNMALCEKLGLNKDTYSVSIPLGATVNMAGAAITISVLSLAAVHTLGIAVDLPTALLLSVLSAVAACGASGVAGGSLLLIPLACSLFGISNDIAMQVVAVGFIIGVVQDSAETALNSSTDVLFTAAACIASGDVKEDAPQLARQHG